jgi:hypothetical protein
LGRARRACDLVRLKVRDICHGDRVAARAIVMQQKTSRPVQFEITESTRGAVAAWIKEAGLRSEDYLFPSRLHESLHLSTRQYAHIVDSWVEEIGLDPANYGHTRYAAWIVVNPETNNAPMIMIFNSQCLGCGRTFFELQSPTKFRRPGVWRDECRCSKALFRAKRGTIHVEPENMAKHCGAMVLDSSRATPG